MIVSIVGMVLFALVLGVIVFVVFKKGSGNMKANKEGFEFTKDKEELGNFIDGNIGWQIIENNQKWSWKNSISGNRWAIIRWNSQTIK